MQISFGTIFIKLFSKSTPLTLGLMSCWKNYAPHKIQKYKQLYTTKQALSNQLGQQWNKHKI